MLRTNKSLRLLSFLVLTIVFACNFKITAKADSPINNYFTVDSSKSITGFAPNIQNDPFVTITNS